MGKQVGMMIHDGHRRLMMRVCSICLAAAFAAAACSRAGLYQAMDSSLLSLQPIFDTIITHWQFIDGGGVNGLNVPAAFDGYDISFGTHNWTLHAAWENDDGTSARQVRVAAYQGSGQWLFIDSNGGQNSLNASVVRSGYFPRLMSHWGRLYAIWAEFNGTADQLHMSTYLGGGSWAPVPAIQNANPAFSANNQHLIDFGSWMAVVWDEANPVAQVRVALTDGGAVWAFIDGGGANGINYNPAMAAQMPRAAGFQGGLYVVWRESLQSVRVKRWDGVPGSWSQADNNGGKNCLNYDPARQATNPMLAVYNNRLYAVWAEDSLFYARYQIRLAVYDGFQGWILVDGGGPAGFNYNPNQHAYAPVMAVYGARLYLAWHENDGVTTQVRVAAYGGNDALPAVTFVERVPPGVQGVNFDPARSAMDVTLFVHGLDLYAGWMENNGAVLQIRAAQGLKY